MVFGLALEITSAVEDFVELAIPRAAEPAAASRRLATIVLVPFVSSCLREKQA